jgi:hypothetical protein
MNEIALTQDKFPHKGFVKTILIRHVYWEGTSW